MRTLHQQMMSKKRKNMLWIWVLALCDLWALSNSFVLHSIARNDLGGGGMAKLSKSADRTQRIITTPGSELQRKRTQQREGRHQIYGRARRDAQDNDPATNMYSEPRYTDAWNPVETYNFDKSKGPVNLPSDLASPEINIRRESILFSPDATTREKNNALRVWNTVVTYCPYILTGTEANKADDTTNEQAQAASIKSSSSKRHDHHLNPMARMYNMLFVRIPTICAGIVYSKNLMEGHPLVVDIGFIGNGPAEISPILVFIVLASILR
jgi:hypothetical protein